jgi:predicted nucleotidyltransferase
VKDWKEISNQYGDVCYKNSGYTKITANIADSSDALFTPCTYKLKDVSIAEGPKLTPIAEIVSFRGRFCEQATVGEKIEAQGKVELVTNKNVSSEYYRLIIGSKPSDYMVLNQSI